MMLTRRIVVSACALSLAIPAAAGAARPADPPKPRGPYGITSNPDPRYLVKAKGPYGITSTEPRNFVKAKGPYGMTVSTGPRATGRPAGATSHGAANDWRTAAISEAALLAALALGSTLALSARRRPPRLGTQATQ